MDIGPNLLKMLLDQGVHQLNVSSLVLKYAKHDFPIVENDSQVRLYEEFLGGHFVGWELLSFAWHEEKFTLLLLGIRVTCLKSGKPEIGARS